MPKMPPKSKAPFKEDRSLYPCTAPEARARYAKVSKDPESQAAYRKVRHEYMDQLFATDKAKRDAEIAAGTRPPRVRVPQSPPRGVRLFSPAKTPPPDDKEMGGKGRAERREVEERKAKAKAKNRTARLHAINIAP
jgi:hypothetical protein